MVLDWPRYSESNHKLIVSIWGLIENNITQKSSMDIDNMKCGIRLLWDSPRYDWNSSRLDNSGTLCTPFQHYQCIPCTVRGIEYRHGSYYRGNGHVDIHRDTAHPSGNWRTLDTPKYGIQSWCSSCIWDDICGISIGAYKDKHDKHSSNKVSF